MFPSAPSPTFMSSPAFPIPSGNPNPNPTTATNQSFFFHCLPQNQNPNHSSPPPQPRPDLNSTLTSLTSLLSLSDHTLTSYSLILNQHNADLVPCPFNPHHLMPPESLFTHSLRCPVPLHIDPPNYRDTLKESPQVPFQGISFDQGSNGDLCLSLDHYLADIGSGFFYKDCPGAVNLSFVDNSRKTIVLPKVLSSECVDFVGTGDCFETMVYQKEGIRVLPSTIWNIRREAEGWIDFPNAYSLDMLCVILGLRTAIVNGFKTWIIAHSPYYSIVIDQHLRDHMYLLFNLCLKAIVREAHSMAEAALPMVECPILVQALGWLGSQLSVLYGEVNGKLFALNMFKQCILKNALHLSVFALEKKTVEFQNVGCLHGDVPEGITEVSYDASKQEREASEDVSRRMIFVSQVAAAVTALHERLFLEEKIRQLRASQSVGRYQRLAEHNYISGRSEEERKKRPSYRPIIDHDGLPRQSLTNQETGKAKTKEELLAEERDYKRRRMSYRGKKLKRTPLQVMRDIIEDYTEEIRRAGGIGCFVKGAEEETLSPPHTPLTNRTALEVADHGRNTGEASASERGGDYYRSQSGYSSRGTTSGSASQNEFNRSRWTKSEDHVYPEDLRRSGEHSEKFHHGSSERHRSHDSKSQSTSHRRERYDVKSTWNRNYERESSGLSTYHSQRSSHSVSKSKSRSHEDDDQILELKEKNGSSSRNCSKDSWGQKGFEDRYEPLESHDLYEE